MRSGVLSRGCGVLTCHVRVQLDEIFNKDYSSIMDNKACAHPAKHKHPYDESGVKIGDIKVRFSSM